MFKYHCLNPIAHIGLQRFNDKYTRTDDVNEAEGILVRSASMHEMEFSDNLLAVARAGAGVNNIPLDKCAEKGIVVFNTPGANANAVKELVIAGMLLSSRKIVDAINWASTLKDEGDNVASLVEKGKSAFVGPELSGKTLGVIGLGAIGVMVANVAQHLGMNVVGYDPYISIDAAWSLSRHIKKETDLNALLSEADYITMHVPLNDATKNMISTDQFAIMKDDVRIMNFSRGGLVDTCALKEAIKNGKVGAYVTDFPDASVIGEEKIIAIPHLGASTPESEDNCAIMASEELKGFLENGDIVNSVNLPNCQMPRSTDKRITIIHKNIPKMIGQITNLFSDASINIANMLNKSRGDLAYTMIDVDEAPETIIADIEKIEGVIKVRFI